ncbi:hypothetical protein IMSAGC014_02212 [Bacteroidaceae bacterium]|nr:hypothetical protein IMSAGC014_02212 [Bacteroidaceae bacterium]
MQDAGLLFCSINCLKPIVACHPGIHPIIRWFLDITGSIISIIFTIRRHYHGNRDRLFPPFHRLFNPVNALPHLGIRRINFWVLHLKGISKC